MTNQYSVTVTKRKPRNQQITSYIYSQKYKHFNQMKILHKTLGSNNSNLCSMKFYLHSTLCFSSRKQEQTARCLSVYSRMHQRIKQKHLRVQLSPAACMARKLTLEEMNVAKAHTFQTWLWLEVNSSLITGIHVLGFVKKNKSVMIFFCFQVL